MKGNVALTDEEATHLRCLLRADAASPDWESVRLRARGISERECAPSPQQPPETKEINNTI